jgi:hypothetical protein
MRRELEGGRCGYRAAPTRTLRPIGFSARLWERDAGDHLRPVARPGVDRQLASDRVEAVAHVEQAVPGRHRGWVKAGAVVADLEVERAGV